MKTGTVSMERNMQETARREKESLLQSIGITVTGWFGKSFEAESTHPSASAPSESEMLQIRQQIDYMRAKMDRFGYAAKHRTGQERGRLDLEG